MNFNNIVCYDMETGSANPHTTQPIQIAAVVVDGRRLEIISEFSSYIRPVLDKDEQVKLGLDDIQDEALAKNKITYEQFVDAPLPKTVMGLFTDWVNQYNYKKDRWFAPIKAGYNNNNFDDIILDRLYAKAPYKFGPVDSKNPNKEGLFHAIHNIDVLKYMWMLMENNRKVNSLSFDSMRNYMGMEDTHAHDASYDARQTAELLITVLKLMRQVSYKTKFEGHFKGKGI